MPIDALEELKRLRPSGGPSAETTHRHRAMLMSEIENARDGLAVGPPLKRSPRRQRWYVGGVAAASATALVVLLVARDDSRTVRTVVPTDSSVSPTTTIVPTVEVPPSLGPTARCGDQLPFRYDLPSRYLGPTAGPAPESTVTPQSDQLVMHWSAAQTTIELRWPVDDLEKHLEQVRKTQAQNPQNQGRRNFGFGKSGTTQSGRAWASSSAPLFDGRSEECVDIQITAFDNSSDEAFDSTLLASRALNRSLQPLVKEEQTVERLPAVIPCRGLGGVVATPSRTDPVSMAPQPSLQLALAFYLREVAPLTFPPAGWTELHLPDGTIGYAWQVPSTTEVAYSVVLSVRSDSTGWRVTQAAASGC